MKKIAEVMGIGGFREQQKLLPVKAERSAQSIIFKTQVENRSVTDDCFQKRVIVCPKLYSHRVLIRYLWDEKGAKRLAHGNSKNTNKNFTQTKDSELQKLKIEKDKYPEKVYSEKLVEALVKNVMVERQKIDVVRDLN